MTDRIPVAIWQGTFTVFGVTLHCSVLDDGRRIVDAEDIHKFFEAMNSDEEFEATPDFVEFVKWTKGTGAP